MAGGQVRAGDREPEAGVLLEQRELRAGRGALPSRDEAQRRRPRLVAVPVGALARQSGQFRDLPVRAGFAVGAHGGRPRVLGDVADDGADPVVDVEADGVVHGALGVGGVVAELVEEPDEGVAGPGAVDGDQQPVAVPLGELGDRRGDDLDVVVGGVRGRSVRMRHSPVVSRQTVMRWWP